MLKWKKAFDQDLLIAGKGSSGGCYAFGLNDFKTEKVGSQVKDSLRLQLEQCDSPQGVIIHSSMGGGTGSAFTSCIMEHLRDSDPRIVVHNNLLFPSLTHSSTLSVEPYNAMLSLHFARKLGALNIFTTNKAVHNYWSVHYKSVVYGLKGVNTLLSEFIEHYLSVLAVKSMRDLSSALVPYPTINYVIPTLSL